MAIVVVAVESFRVLFGIQRYVSAPLTVNDTDSPMHIVVSKGKTDKLGIPFVHFSGPYTAVNYQKILKDYNSEWAALSGWLKKVTGLPPEKTFNIHPALLSQLNGRFGGKGMWGHHVHEAVKESLDKGEITESGLTMHFVTDEYDRGPIFFEHKIPLKKDMTGDEIGELVNKAEHKWQPIITEKVIHGEIRFNIE